MRIKVISCAIFKPYIEIIGMNNDERFDISYLEIDQHNEPEKLYKSLQNEINRVKNVDKIVLLYGICGNAIKNIYTDGIPLIIPKAHDCCTILLGSRKRFQELFSHRPSQGWSCISYTSKEMNRTSNYLLNDEYLKLVDEYGEDNAKYVYETMYAHDNGQKVYITFHSDGDHLFLQNTEEDFEIIKGDMNLLEKIMEQQFDEDFIILKQNEKLKLCYDYDQVIMKEQM